MTQVAIQVSDRASADTLVELLASFELDFVEQISIDEMNGSPVGTTEQFTITADDDTEFLEIPRFHVSPERPQMQKEEAAFEQMLPTLLANYLGEYVAIYQQQLVDHDEDEIALVERVHATYPNAVILVKQVSDVPEQPIVIRSPRFVG